MQTGLTSTSPQLTGEVETVCPRGDKIWGISKAPLQIAGESSV